MHLHSVTLSILCVISFWLITRMLAQVFSVSRDDDLLGGMWAVVATIFVYRYSYEESVGAAFSRMGATLLSFALCFLYLLFFPFHLWGLAVLIGIGAVAMSLLRRPDDVITTGITTGTGQSRDGSRTARSPLRRMGRGEDAPAGARCKIRFSVRQRFPLEYQERAEGTPRELE